MIRENQAIKFYEEEKTKLQASRVTKMRYLDSLKKRVESLNQQIVDEEENIKSISEKIKGSKREIKGWENEKSWKRKCFALVKKHNYIGFDDSECTDEEDSWDYPVTFWFWSDDFDSDDQSDPYHDAHFCYGWGELLLALKDYVKIRRDKEIDAELDREEASEKV